jgi:hypothetical protein
VSEKSALSAAADCASGCALDSVPAIASADNNALRQLNRAHGWDKNCINDPLRFARLGNSRQSQHLALI